MDGPRSDPMQNGAAGTRTASEPGTDEITGPADAAVVPSKSRQRAERVARTSGSGAAGSPVAEAATTPAAEHTESLIVPSGEHQAAADNPSPGGPAPGPSERQHGRLSRSPQRTGDQVTVSSYAAAWLDDDPAFGVDKRESARKLAIAVTLVLGLGGLLYAAWPDEETPTSSIETMQPIAANGGQAPVMVTGPEDPTQLYAGPDAMADAGAGLTPEEKAGMASDATAAASSLQQWFDSDGAATSDVALPQDAARITAVPQAQSPAAPASSVAPAFAAQQTSPPSPAPAPAQSRVTAVAAPPPAAAAPAATARALAPQRTSGSATAPPARTTGAATFPAARATGAATSPAPRTVAAGNVRPMVSAQRAPGIISSQARWISGGPSDADNRRGRYRGSVVVQFTILPSGVVSNCRAVRPSGNAEMDALTCRLFTQRARFTPARDGLGRAVASQAHATYVWGRGRRSRN